MENTGISESFLSLYSKEEAFSQWLFPCPSPWIGEWQLLSHRLTKGLATCLFSPSHNWDLYSFTAEYQLQVLSCICLWHGSVLIFPLFSFLQLFLIFPFYFLVLWQNSPVAPHHHPEHWQALPLPASLRTWFHSSLVWPPLSSDGNGIWLACLTARGTQPFVSL